MPSQMAQHQQQHLRAEPLLSSSAQPRTFLSEPGQPEGDALLPLRRCRSCLHPGARSACATGARSAAPQVHQAFSQHMHRVCLFAGQGAGWRQASQRPQPGAQCRVVICMMPAELCAPAELLSGPVLQPQLLCPPLLAPSSACSWHGTSAQDWSLACQPVEQVLACTLRCAALSPTFAAALQPVWLPPQPAAPAGMHCSRWLNAGSSVGTSCLQAT